MPRVNFNGQMQEYNLLTPLQRDQYAAEQALRSAEKQDVFRNHSTADDTLRALPDAAKAALRASGYRGDLSLPPPGPNSGSLVQTTIRNRAGHTIDTYHGDPRAWMDQFAPAVKMQAIAFRGEHMPEHTWDAVCRDRFQRWQRQNPDKVGDAAIKLMRS